ncbi:hypothetical protein RA28_03090 [Ruegeria sp. ANG-S4]|uniref:hypothetical protein n=1 Tax=Ruegeria sp. ANG-S4 TaxID=1577904 RepID=UPI00057CE8EE|nr:hypothetical protein [Ruegeria sp. ANG-S4]KIC46756.1 hypothetical protein RA28_03090 [Ruegeria sp. ANG-S4]
MKPIVSVITTSQREPSSKTGMLAGEHGLAIQENLEVSAWLSRQTPHDVDTAAVSRALSRGVELNVVYEGRYPRGQNGESLGSFSVATSCTAVGTNEQRAKARQDLLKFLTPACRGQIEEWIAELSVITAGAGRNGFEAELMVSAYTRRLLEFPADIVRYALVTKTWKWFPAWDELEQVCKIKISPRLLMLQELSRQQPDPAPVRRSPTEEERAAIQKLVDETFPRQARGFCK